MTLADAVVLARHAPLPTVAGSLAVATELLARVLSMAAMTTVVVDSKVVVLVATMTTTVSTMVEMAATVATMVVTAAVAAAMSVMPVVGQATPPAVVSFVALAAAVASQASQSSLPTSSSEATTSAVLVEAVVVAVCRAPRRATPQGSTPTSTGRRSSVVSCRSCRHSPSVSCDLLAQQSESLCRVDASLRDET